MSLLFRLTLGLDHTLLGLMKLSMLPSVIEVGLQRTKLVFQGEDVQCSSAGTKQSIIVTPTCTIANYLLNGLLFTTDSDQEGVSRKLRPKKLRPSVCLKNSDPKNSVFRGSEFNFRSEFSRHSKSLSFLDLVVFVTPDQDVLVLDWAGVNTVYVVF